MKWHAWWDRWGMAAVILAACLFLIALFAVCATVVGGMIVKEGLDAVTYSLIWGNQ